MGSASRQALDASRKALAAAGATVDVGQAEALFGVGRAIAESGQLASILADPASDTASKDRALTAVFGARLSGIAATLARAIVAERWSNADDLMGGFEEIAVRAAAMAAGPSASIEAEIFAFSRAVSSDAELELTLGSKLGDSEGKAALAARLLKGKANPATVAIVTALVAQPRGRRIGALLTHAAALVADQAGASVATVSSAQALTPAQLSAVATSLTKTYGRAILVNAVVDPDLIGGIRIQVGDDVIDGSVASRLNELRRELVG